MGIVFWTVFEHLINVFQGISCSAFIFLMLEYKSGKIQKLLSYSCCSILVYLALTISNRITAFEGIAIFVYSAILFVFAVFLFDGSVLKKLIISIIPVNALAVGSIFSTNAVSSFADVPILELMTEGSQYRLITVIISNAVFVSILAIIVFVSRRVSIELDNHEWVFIGVVLFISVITFNFIYNIVFEITSRTGKLNISLAVLGLVAINITIYVLLISLSKKNKVALENSLLKQQVRFQEMSSKEIKRQYEHLHKVRHDFNNMLKVIQSLNDSGKKEQIDEYIQEYQKTQNGAIQVVSTDNDYINAIVNSKVAEAKEFSIDVVLSVVQEIGKLNTLEICSLLGNMFDNAIEACKKCKGSKSIVLDISRRNSDYEILMRNSICASVLSNNPTLTTSKMDRENHGYGTKIINEIAGRNHGFADFYEDGDMFCCHVIVSFEEK